MRGAYTAPGVPSRGMETKEMIALLANAGRAREDGGRWSLVGWRR